MSSVCVLHHCFSCIPFCCWDRGGMHVCTCTSTCGGQRSTNIVLHFIFRDRVSPWTQKLIGSSRAADQQAPEILLPPLQQCEDCKFVPITAFLCGRWDSQSSSPPAPIASWAPYWQSHLQLPLVFRRLTHFTHQVPTVGLRPGRIAQW